MDFKQELIDGKAKLGVWGCGYIGFTTMVNFAKEGVYSIGYDVDARVAESIRRGESHIPNLDFWIGHHIGELVKNMMTVTTDVLNMMGEEIKVHLIAVPTEKDGEPWFEPLQNVMDNLNVRMPSIDNPDLIIMESTLTPGMFDKVVVGTLGKRAGKEFLVGIAPRRDWFDSPEKNLKVLKRVIGGTNPETTEAMFEVLSIICDNLIKSDAETTELVKSVENSIFHICAVYACQLSSAYPRVDIAEVLRLASTHWRIPLYFPSVGTGGYCIPVSSKYVRDGAEHPEELWLTDDAISYDSQRPYSIAQIMAKKTKGIVGVLGLSYKKDLKVHVLSPSLKIIDGLKDEGVTALAFDPYYEDDEVRNITRVNSLKYPDDLKYLGGIVIVPPHRIFSQTPKNILLSNLREGQVILDNEGVWKKWRNDFEAMGIDYHCVGDKGWAF